MGRKSHRLIMFAQSAATMAVGLLVDLGKLYMILKEMPQLKSKRRHNLQVGGSNPPPLPRKEVKMKCWKCGKEMDREDGGFTIKGVDVKVTLDAERKTPENIAYQNLQLGKYSDGHGESHVGICYECYIDGLFNIKEG
jgi:hypothetical protein